jgi:hypothetical protein
VRFASILFYLASLITLPKSASACLYHCEHTNQPHFFMNLDIILRHREVPEKHLVEPSALEEFSCECYKVVKQSSDRLCREKHAFPWRYERMQIYHKRASGGWRSGRGKECWRVHLRKGN